MSQLADDVREAMRDIPDFPRDGVLFKDITPILADHGLTERIIDAMADGWGEVDVVVGMESRGFLFGVSVAQKLGAGFAPARKKGKLPHATVSVDFELEYGSATLEMHVDALKPGDKVLIIDDLLATGGTARATLELVRRLGGEVVGFGFLVELGFLDGRGRLDADVRSILTVP
jgi:adenine phosphoribosyltransferase